jgi:hypothetical protein
MNIPLDDKTLGILNKIADKHDNQDIEFVIYNAIEYFILLHKIPVAVQAYIIMQSLPLEDQITILEIMNSSADIFKLKGSS